jgi:hypothetical protein
MVNSHAATVRVILGAALATTEYVRLGNLALVRASRKGDLEGGLARVEDSEEQAEPFKGSQGNAW